MPSASPAPLGGSVLHRSGRRNTPIRVVSGESLRLVLSLRAPDGTTATPENTEVVATLKDQLFSDDVIWRGSWMDGISRGDDGPATITVPRRIVDTLRRGAYIIGILVGDKQPDGERVACSPVYLEVDYTPGGATSTIPYHE